MQKNWRNKSLKNNVIAVGMEPAYYIMTNTNGEIKNKRNRGGSDESKN